MHRFAGRNAAAFTNWASLRVRIKALWRPLTVLSRFEQSRARAPPTMVDCATMVGYATRKISDDHRVLQPHAERADHHGRRCYPLDVHALRAGFNATSGGTHVARGAIVLRLFNFRSFRSFRSFRCSPSLPVLPRNRAAGNGRQQAARSPGLRLLVPSQLCCAGLSQKGRQVILADDFDAQLLRLVAFRATAFS
jgi:hypothetical protein